MTAKELLPLIKSKSKGDKFSEYLVKFLKTRRDWPIFAAFSQWNEIDGEDIQYSPDKTQTRNIIIGYGDMDDGWVHGARLSSIIGGRAGKEQFAYSPAFKCILLPDWFDRYIEGGKCCIDPEHRLYADSERWEVSPDGKDRRCIWCGNHEQYLHTEMVPRQSWRTKI